MQRLFKMLQCKIKKNLNNKTIKIKANKKPIKFKIIFKFKTNKNNKFKYMKKMINMMRSNRLKNKTNKINKKSNLFKKLI